MYTITITKAKIGQDNEITSFSADSYNDAYRIISNNIKTQKDEYLHAEISTSVGSENIMIYDAEYSYIHELISENHNYTYLFDVALKASSLSITKEHDGYALNATDNADLYYLKHMRFDTFEEIMDYAERYHLFDDSVYKTLNETAKKYPDVVAKAESLGYSMPIWAADEWVNIMNNMDRQSDFLINCAEDLAVMELFDQYVYFVPNEIELDVIISADNASGVEISETSPKYTVKAYIDDRFRNLCEDAQTYDINKAIDFAHQYLSSGYDIEISDRTGGSIQISADEYSKSFDGEFILSPQELYNLLHADTAPKKDTNKGFEKE